MVCNCKCYCGMRPLSTLSSSDAEKKNCVNFYKQLFVSLVSVLEFLNEKYDPYGLNLNKWGRDIATRIDDYTHVFEELYEKYKDMPQVQMSPELKLYCMTISSGIAQHVVNSLFDNKQPILGRLFDNKK